VGGNLDGTLHKRRDRYLRFCRTTSPGGHFNFLLSGLACLTCITIGGIAEKV
jgi:hypothetical protein